MKGLRVVNNTSYKVINVAGRAAFLFQCRRSQDSKRPPGPVQSSLWYGRLTLLQGRWFIGELRRLPTKFLIRRWHDSTWRWYRWLEMIKMTDFQVSATNTIPKGGGRSSYICIRWWNLDTSHLFWSHLQETIRFGMKQLAKTAFKRNVDLPKQKVSSTVHLSPKILGW